MTLDEALWYTYTHDVTVSGKDPVLKTGATAQGVPPKGRTAPNSAARITASSNRRDPFASCRVRARWRLAGVHLNKAQSGR